MTDSLDRRCSSCGKAEDLSLVIGGYSPGGMAGRILLYCETCKANRPESLAVSIPVELVTEEVFVDLYRHGWTESDPAQAAKIVFGEAQPNTAARAGRALGARNGTPLHPDIDHPLFKAAQGVAPWPAGVVPVEGASEELASSRAAQASGEPDRGNLVLPFPSMESCCLATTSTASQLLREPWRGAVKT